MPYQPSDDDLPESFWPDKPAPKPRQVDPRLAAEETVRRLYPALLEKEQPAARKPKPVTKAALDEQEHRRKYVKRKKKAQMRTWLWSLRDQGALDRMNGWERTFSENILEKFDRFGLDTKWLTQAQFDATMQLATKYLQIPRKAG